jgi:hypothetical protein
MEFCVFGELLIDFAIDNPLSSPSMKRQDYYPTRQAEQAVWLGNFSEKLQLHAVEMDLNQSEVSETVSDAKWLMYLIINWLEAVRTYSKAATETLETAQTGKGDKFMTLPVLIPPTPKNGETPRTPGALRRIFEMAATVRGNPACTPAIRADLGLDGALESGPDPDTLRPVIAAQLTASGVRIDWNWQGWSKFLDQCEIQVDRGDGQGWRILTFDTTPGYLDTTAAPATHTRWKYRAIYHAGDATIGGWSAEASVSLGGD